MQILRPGNISSRALPSLRALALSAVPLLALASLARAVPAPVAAGVPTGELPPAHIAAQAAAHVTTWLRLVGGGAAGPSAHGRPVPGTVLEMLPSALVRGAAAAPADARALATDAALDALEAHVHRSSDPGALRAAFHAYYGFRAARPHAVRKPYLYYVDLGLDNRTARGWVFDMETLSLIDGPFHVAHGRGSSRERDGVPTNFSNRPGSYASSLGLYVAEGTYAFSGRANGGRYSSIGLRMRGESGAFNDAALQRGIVAHGAPYVTAVAAGRSEGCPAMEEQRARRLLPMLANGGVVFIYSPHDPVWLGRDPWMM